jgi:hypothetical protein
MAFVTVSCAKGLTKIISLWVDFRICRTRFLSFCKNVEARFGCFCKNVEARFGDFCKNVEARFGVGFEVGKAWVSGAGGGLGCAENGAIG